MKKPFGKDRLVLFAFLIVLLVFGVLVGRKYLQSTSTPKAPASEAQEPRALREVILYFGGPEGASLVAEAREIEDCLDESSCITATVQALVNGPIGEALPIFPSHAVVRGVKVAEGVATVDFSRALVTAHPGGSGSELLTVYGLADTLAVNFPHIRQVRFLIEGEPVETLKGHVDLRQPVSADFSLTRSAEQDGKPQADVPASGNAREGS